MASKVLKGSKTTIKINGVEIEGMSIDVETAFDLKEKYLDTYPQLREWTKCKVNPLAGTKSFTITPTEKLKGPYRYGMLSHKMARPKNKKDKFCTECLKTTRLLVHCGHPTQKK